MAERYSVQYVTRTRQGNRVYALVDGTRRPAAGGEIVATIGVAPGQDKVDGLLTRIVNALNAAEAVAR